MLPAIGVVKNMDSDENVIRENLSNYNTQIGANVSFHRASISKFKFPLGYEQILIPEYFLLREVFLTILGVLQEDFLVNKKVYWKSVS